MALDDLKADLLLLARTGLASPLSVFEHGLGASEADPEGDPAAVWRATLEAFEIAQRLEAEWSELTDCDRLQQALELLERQGLVARTNWGMTVDDGIARAADVAAALDEARLGPVVGFCFCHQQDVWSALGSDGLYLAFGSFLDAPADHGEEIGRAVVVACQQCGLRTSWDGTGRTRIYLPDFRWEQRGRRLPPGDDELFIASWKYEMVAGYTDPAECHDVLEERARDWYGEVLELTPGLLEQLHGFTDQLLHAEQVREASWEAATVNDRIAAAFADLAAAGVFTRECLGRTIQDGWGYVGVQADPLARGAVFFHQEDVLDALEGRGMWLAFGSLATDGPDEAIETQRLAEQTLLALASYGVACEWSGSLEQRIRILPFEWCRRRFTPPPRLGPRAPQDRPQAGQTVSNNTLRKFHDAPRVADVELVVGLRDEGGFDLRRSRRLRAQRPDEQVQVGHLGTPHAFVPAGSHTTMIAVPADYNLREERTQWLRRGSR